jgi:hypothetical protein
MNVVKIWRAGTDKELLEAAQAYRAEMFDCPTNKELADANFLSMDYQICASLQGQLSYEGIDCALGESVVKLSAGKYGIHHFIKLKDGRVLDPCADAFNEHSGFEKMPKVYLGPPHKIHRELEE